MAYADATNTTRKLGTGAVVLLIEGALGVALVTGLAVNFTARPEPRIDTYNLPPEKKTPPPPPPVDRTVKQDHSVIDQPKTMVELPPSAGPTFTEELVRDSGNSDTGLGEVVFPRDPDPVPSPEPAFKPKGAAPKGAWKQWVTTNDYPTAELRAEREGTVRYRLAIDASGRAIDCTVTQSSGAPGLDRATCDTLRRRARFEPATNQTGARTPGSYSGSVTWQIPKE